MSDERQRLGSSGVFRVIVEGARKFKRALSENDAPVVQELGNQIADAFISGRMGDVYALTTSGFQKRNPKEQFETRWTDSVRERGPLTAYQVSNAGQIDIGYIPGLEEVSQDDFVGMVQIAFATDKAQVDEDKAFTIAVVFLDDDGAPRIGAIHTS